MCIELSSYPILPYSFDRPLNLEAHHFVDYRYLQYIHTFDQPVNDETFKLTLKPQTNLSLSLL